MLGVLVPYAAITCWALSYAYWPWATPSQLSLRITPEFNSIATLHNPMSHMRELGRTNQIVR